MRCRNGVTEKLLSVTETTALHSPKHPRDCVRRASGFVLTAHPSTTSPTRPDPVGFLGYFFSPAVQFVTTVSGGADA